jgi:di/tricarboxylate transporter
MTPLILTLLILLITVGLFLSNWLRLDLVAILMLLALMLSGVITLEEGLAGFSDPVVVMITALFVIGGSLLNTGTAQLLGQGITRLTGKHETRIIWVLMISTALLSGLMSSTGTAAIFLPIALSLAHQAGIAPSRLLMPMAFSALLGGMLTLIGTPPNLIVANTLKQAGLTSFRFFDFTLPGLAALALSLAYFSSLGRWLLPHTASGSPPKTESAKAELPSVQDLLRNYDSEQNLTWMRLPPGSVLYGKTLKELALNKRYGVQILSLLEPHRWRDHHYHFCRAQTRLEPNQDILVAGAKENLAEFAKDTGAAIIPKDASSHQLGNPHLGLAEILLLPRSGMQGKTLAELFFRERYGLHVLAIQRQQTCFQHSLEQLPLRFGDLLLVQGSWKRILRLGLEKRDFTSLNLPAEAETPHYPPFKIGLTMFWLVLMIFFLLTGLLPIVSAILLTATGLVLTRCLSMEEAYQSISWESVILIACMLPMATALKNTGGTEALGNWLSQNLASLGPYSIMAVLFVLTSGCSLFISNTATTVLIAPVALQLALSLNYSPQTFMMVVALAASSSFATPVASPVNTMVLAPGGYRFIDYLKVGLPLQLFMLGLTLLLLPRLFGL